MITLLFSFKKLIVTVEKKKKEYREHQEIKGNDNDINLTHQLYFSVII